MLLLEDKYVNEQDGDDDQLLSRDNYINKQDSDQLNINMLILVFIHFSGKKQFLQF